MGSVSNPIRVLAGGTNITLVEIDVRSFVRVPQSVCFFEFFAQSCSKLFAGGVLQVGAKKNHPAE